MPYATITDDIFDRADTEVGSAGGSTNVTGPTTFAAPSTGAAYYDWIGNIWSIKSGKLVPIDNVASSSLRGTLTRPTAEAILNQRVTAYGAAGLTGSTLAAIARRISTNNCYAAYVFNTPANRTFAVAYLSNNGQTINVLGTTTFDVSHADDFAVQLLATGSSPTTLTATLYAASDLTTPLATIGPIQDSTAADLQVAAPMGVSCNWGGTTPTKTQVSRLITEQVTQASKTTILPTNGSVYTNTAKTYSVGFDGTIPTGSTVVVNLSTTIGTLSQNTLTFVGSGSVPTAQSVTLTGPATIGTGTLTGTHTVTGTAITLADFASIPLTVTLPPLTIGTLSAAQASTGITLSASAAPAGGAGGYSLKIYRGTDPNFTASASTLLATVAALPYTDGTAVAGVPYYYGIVLSDSAGTTVNAVPAGLGTLTGTNLLYVGATIVPQDIALVFGPGDSITYGATVTNAGTVLAPTAAFYAIQKLKALTGRNVTAANVGVSGSTSFDWRPGGALGYYAAAKTAMTALLSATPSALPVFSVMLGTNDSASAGTRNGNSATGATITGALTPAQYTANMQTLINQILADFPNAKVIVHESPYYTPNTHNASTYEQAGLATLATYRAAVPTLVASYASAHPSQVYVGDTKSWDYFRVHYADELTGESGNNGTFHLHPSGVVTADGRSGTQSIGTLWGTSIASVLNGPVASGPRVFSAVGGAWV